MSHVPTVVYPFQPESEVDLYLPRGHMRKWKLTPTTLTVQFGNKTVRARITGSNRSSQCLLRKSLLDSLHLPAGLPLRATYQANRQTLVFGPYLGILISSYNAQYPRSPFGPLTPFFNETADVCRKRGGIVCAFRLQDVNWDAGLVRGLVRRGDLWREKLLPLPQCIYNRLVSRRRERSEWMAAWVQRCKNANISFFNEQFLNKWDVHSALENQEGAQAHLPGMMRYQGEEQLGEMLSRYRSVYAKPSNGSMGRGIIRLRRNQNGYEAARPGGARRQFASLPALHRYLQKLTNGKSYLLQQGLPLIGLQGRPADFRVLVQKNRAGEWAVTSMVARIGQNRIVSNVSRGGSMLAPLQALRLCGPWHGNIRPSPQKLKSVALKLSVLLDQALPGHYAEFGIDLGVDVYGHVWLLEVNSKPSKTANAVPNPSGAPEATRKARPSVIRMFDYASWLCGFPRAARKKPKR